MLTVAVNCVVFEAVSVAVKGLTPTPMLRMAVSWTVALADFVGSATLVAVIVTACAVLIREGAVYNPFNRVPNAGVMDQFTDVFELPVTVAVNCLDWEAVRVALEGPSATLTLAGGADREIVPVPPLAVMESPVAVDATTAET